MHESSTQVLHWRFSGAELLKCREQKFRQAVLQIESETVDVQSIKDIPIKESRDEEAIIHHYLEKLSHFSNSFSHDVFATAVVFFKRFYISHSILKHDPHLYMLTSLFVATKACENFQTIDKFIRTLPESARLPSIASKLSLDSDNGDPIVDSLRIERDHIEPIVNAEFELLAGIKFHLTVHLPFRPLYGFVLDAETFIVNELSRDTPSEAKKQLINDIYSRSIGLARHLFVNSDVMFQFSPAQIAFYCFYIAVQQDLADVKLDVYLKARFSESERLKLLNVVDQIKTIPHFTSSSNIVGQWLTYYERSAVF